MQGEGGKPQLLSSEFYQVKVKQRTLHYSFHRYGSHALVTGEAAVTKTNSLPWGSLRKGARGGEIIKINKLHK